MLACNIAVFCQTHERFLKYRPSQLAAAIVIISVNIHMRDEQKSSLIGAFQNGDEPVDDETGFFSLSERNEEAGQNQLLLNRDIWDK